MITHKKAALYFLLNPASIMSSGEIRAIAKEFKQWCNSRDEMNPRTATLEVWLEINYPDDFRVKVNYNFNEIWETIYEIV